MIISIDAEGFVKPQHPFVIKTLTKLGTDKKANLIKSHIWQTHSQHTEEGKTMYFLKIRNNTRLSTLTTLAQYSVWKLRAIRQEKDIKGILIGRKKSNYPCLQIIWFFTYRTPQNSILLISKNKIWWLNSAKQQDTESINKNQ